VSEHKPQDRLGFLEQQFKRKPAWHTTVRRGSAAQAWTCGHRAVATAGEIGGSEQSGHHARREKLAVPRPVIVVRPLAGAFAPQHAADASLQRSFQARELKDRVDVSPEY
jgi:hypothetical protein